MVAVVVAPAFGWQNVVNWHEPHDAIQTAFTKQIYRGPETSATGLASAKSVGHMLPHVSAVKLHHSWN
jgi:hypothetical protein